MRQVQISFAAAVAVVALESVPAQSQDWSQYLAFDDAFSINFPGEPHVRETTYATEYELDLPARVYTAEDDFGVYSVTVVDWGDAVELHAALHEACQAATGDLLGGDNPGICSADQAQDEILGADLHAASAFLKSGSEVTYFARVTTEGVEGIRIHLLNEDGSRTYAAMYWHEYHLYILEATAPAGMPPPNTFPVSIGFVDEFGRRIRYAERYIPLLPAPPRAR